MWATTYESHDHTRVRGVSGHHTNHLGPCGNTVHSFIHSVVLIAFDRVSSVALADVVDIGPSDLLLLTL